MRKTLAFLVIVLAVNFSLQSQVVISEFLARNDAALADESNDYDDWIEIHNPGPEMVDIGGYYITDDKNEPKKFQIAKGDASTQIYPGGFLILWADEDTKEGVLHLDIKLNGDGEEIYLYLPDGETLVDSVVFDEQEDDVSYGREKNTGNKWMAFTDPTPGASNKAASRFTPEKIRRIKVYPNPFEQELVFKNIPDECVLQLRNMNGQVVHAQSFDAGKNYLDLSGFDSGTYVFRIRTKQNQFIKHGKVVRK